jgi:hypothetical protein
MADVSKRKMALFANILADVKKGNNTMFGITW